MSEERKPELPRENGLILNGKPATKAEYKRIVYRSARRSNPKERATKPIETMSRGFKLMR